MKSLKSLVSPTRPRSSVPPHVPQPALPILRQNYSRGDIYVPPRLADPHSGESIHLDRAAAQYTRALIVGPAGSGKTAALEFIARGARVFSLANAHPGALPSNLSDSPILLDDARASHSEYLAGLAHQYASPIYVTTQDSQGFPDDFTILDLRPLNDREIGAVAEAWFPSGRPARHGGHQVVQRAADQVVSAIKANQRSRLLASNALNLFLLLQVYTNGEPLPTHRADLFDAYVGASLQQYKTQTPSSSASASSTVDPDFAARALEGIALAIKRGEVAKPEHLSRGYDLMRELPSGRVEFVHPLLRDFLAARALRRNPDVAPMLEHAFQEDWRQVLLFYAGLGDPTALAQALLDGDRVDLAAHALAESLEVPVDLEKRVTEPLIRQAWEVGTAEAVSALRALRSNAAADFFAGRLKERDPAARKRAASILGVLNTDRAVEYLLPQLRDTDAGVRDQVVTSLGSSTSDRVVEPLLVALRGDTRVGTVDTRMRVAAARALGEIGAERAVPALIVDLQVGEPEVRAEAVQALVKIGSHLAYKPLRAIVEGNQSSEVRAAAQQVLESI